MDIFSAPTKPSKATQLAVEIMMATMGYATLVHFGWVPGWSWGNWFAALGVWLVLPVALQRIIILFK